MGKSKQVVFDVFDPRLHDMFDPTAHIPAHKHVCGYVGTHGTFGLAKEDGRWNIYHLPTGLRCGAMENYQTGMAILMGLDLKNDYLRDVLQGSIPQWGMAPDHGYGRMILALYESWHVVFNRFKNHFEFAADSNVRKMDASSFWRKN